MGRDRVENEDLIRYGLSTDHWFHVDDMSSAHVYLRLRSPEERIEDVDPQTIKECAALVKANSIEGCKRGEVTVVHTPWANLHKTADMEVGAIGFHDRKLVTRVKVGKNNPVVNKLNRTKTEEFPDLFELQQAALADEVARNKECKREERRVNAEQKAAREEEATSRSYSSLMDADKMISNADLIGGADDTAAAAFEDDFM
jgi:hypothetical protein